MSFVGGIGHLMEGSGITELLETVYAPNAVTHMTSGKAIARAVRAHFLIDTALTSIILSHIYGIPLPDEIENETGTNDINPANYINTDSTDINADDLSDELHEADAMLDELLKGDISVEKACDDVLIDQIKSRIDNFRKSHKSYRTSQLWFQYMDMIDILRRFIKAEKTSGHNLYVKSSRVYLQQMENLKTTHPEVLAFLQSGHHVIRRSDTFWAGLSSDLVIEQVLMRSLKTTGGMTRGRGMSEGQRAQWILSMPDCAEMNNALQEFTGVNYGTSDQHKEGGESRRSRDCQDLKTFYRFLLAEVLL
ncbi:unnamed protein product [Mytilus edulis]|uniref:Uncharacterized protein n=1 Tax=Mytilus edulis TaxID=6550 RepID=A0A8S3U841_MYTED|nr:unnamed protein product [Mytilus edulis]